jgi:hypothetical protein
MGDDYAFPNKRKTKRDKKAKKKYGVYKKGGKFRTTEVKESNEGKETKKKRK